MADEGYQGYTNYETWAVNLWIDNDQGLHEMVMEWTEEVAGEENPEYELARMIRDFVEEYNPLADEEASMYSDLLSSAISSVNWMEIAEMHLEMLTEA